MQIIDDLAFILKSYRFQERDQISVLFTEKHGKMTVISKGSVSSKRFAGALQAMNCSRVSIRQKPNSELALLDSAVVHYSFDEIAKDLERFATANFYLEFTLKMIEPNQPLREVFVLLSQALFYLTKTLPPTVGLAAFLCRMLKILGYSPSLLRCVHCQKGAHELMNIKLYWNSKAGGMVCQNCLAYNSSSLPELALDGLLLFERLTTQSIKQQAEKNWSEEELQMTKNLTTILLDFLYHHVPNIPNDGFKSLQWFQ